MELDSQRLDFLESQQTSSNQNKKKQRSLIKSKDPNKKSNELEENLHLEICRCCRHRLLEPLVCVSSLLVCVSSLFSLGFWVFFFGFTFFAQLFSFWVSSASSGLLMELECETLNFKEQNRVQMTQYCQITKQFQNLFN